MCTKRITQATFDEVVRENIEDLELSNDEAIIDAIAQFKAQGVDLGNIVTDLVSSENGSCHRILNHLNALKTLERIDDNALCGRLKEFQIECEKSLAHRCLAASHGAFCMLMGLLSKLSENKDLMAKTLATLCSFLNGQPDLVSDDAMDTFLTLAKHDDADLCLLGIRLIRLSCVMHERNRQTYVGKSLIHVLAAALKRHREDKAIVKEACQALRTLTLDDDPRVVFGKAHDHAKSIVMEANALELLLEIAKELDDEAVLGDLFTTVGCLAVRNEFCQRIMDLGGLNLMLETLQNNMRNKVIATQIIGVLKTIAGNDEVKVAIAKSSAPSIIIATMDKHQGSEALCANACACLATVSLRNPENCRTIMGLLGHVAIVQCMKIHPESSNVQKQACMAIRNIVSRTKEYVDAVLALGTEALLNKALEKLPDVKDEAKAALRDLGCKVELKEMWTGEKGGLER